MSVEYKSQLHQFALWLRAIVSPSLSLRCPVCEIGHSQGTK